MISRYAAIAVCAIFPGGAWSQTLTQGAMTPAVGSEVQYRYCPYQDPGSGGAGQTWDFSGAGSTESHTILFTAPGSTPNSADFPGATLAQEYDAPSGFFGYVELNADGAYGLGSDMSGLYSVHYTDTKQDLKFPLSFGGSWSDTFFGNLNSFGSTGTLDGTVSGEADGYGTLILPWGTITNVLRVRLQTITLQTILTPPPGGTNTVDETAYFFYKPGIPTQLASTASANTGTSSFIYMDESSIGLEDVVLGSIGIDIAPNPAPDALTFRFGATGHVRATILNTLGAVIHLEDLGAKPPGIHRQEIDIRALPVGNYLLRLLSDDGQSGSRQFCVQR